MFTPRRICLEAAPPPAATKAAPVAAPASPTHASPAAYTPCWPFPLPLCQLVTVARFYLSHRGVGRLVLGVAQGPALPLLGVGPSPTPGREPGGGERRLDSLQGMFLVPKTVTSVHVSLTAQALSVLAGALSCPQRRVLPGVAGWRGGQRGRGCGHFLGGQDSLSLAHSAKVKKGPWSGGRTRTQMAAFEEFAGNVCLAPTTLWPLLPNRGLQEGLSQAWGREGKSVPPCKESSQGRKGKKSSSREQPPNSYPSAKALMSPWRLAGHLSSNQNWLYPDEC